MCRPVVCNKCSKTTWSGCGMHVAQVMSGVPKDQQCKGHDNDPVDVRPQGTLTPGRGLLGWLRRN